MRRLEDLLAEIARHTSIVAIACLQGLAPEQFDRRIAAGPLPPHHLTCGGRTATLRRQHTHLKRRGARIVAPWDEAPAEKYMRKVPATRRRLDSVIAGVSMGSVAMENGVRTLR